MTRSTGNLRTALCVSVIATGAFAQRGSGDWMTAANDAQRSSWVRSDGKISPASMAKPGFELVWKMKLDSKARQLNTIATPSLLDFYIGYRGFRALGFFGVSSGEVVAVDTELGRVEWGNKYSEIADSRGTPACPGGMTAAVTRPTSTEYPPLPRGGGSGRGSPAKSGVGEPHEGSVVLLAMAARRPPIPSTPAPPPAQRVKPSAASFSPFAPHVQSALALTSDGKLHSLWVSNGNEPAAGLPFIPPNAHAVGLIAYDNTAYVATTNGCGAAGNGVWAMDLSTGKVNHWTSSQDIAGNAGPAIGPDGTLYAATGSSVVALSPKQLEPQAIYKAPGVSFASSPVVFEYQGRNLLAVASVDGRVHLLDTSSLSSGTELATSAPLAASGYETGSLTSWQDPAGTRWILAPTQSAVKAWKLGDRNGKLALQAGWTSRELVAPLPPVVVNGVVFALASGEFRGGDAKLTAEQRAQRSGKAVLYALDALSGKELWNSGNTITSFAHSAGLAAGGGRVYVATYDGMQYAFGFPIEH